VPEDADVFDMPSMPAAPAPRETSHPSQASAAPSTAPATSGPKAAQSQRGGGGEVAAIFADATSLGVADAEFEQYTEKRWGRGWKLNAGGRKRAHDEVRGFAQDAAGFQAKVKAELHDFS
jgi:hypothetical protein